MITMTCIARGFGISAQHSKWEVWISVRASEGIRDRSLRKGMHKTVSNHFRGIISCLREVDALILMISGVVHSLKSRRYNEWFSVP